MTELANIAFHHTGLRYHLLATASAAALIAFVSAAEAEDISRPTVWLELGGQLEQLKAGQDPYVPSFAENLPEDGLFSPSVVQKSLKSSFGGEGSLLFEPGESDWVFSASVRFGRSNGVRHQHQQTPNAKIPLHVPFLPTFAPYYPGQYAALGSYYPSKRVKFADAETRQSESDVVLDFQAGKDVGLGIFGVRGSSVLSTGVRFAQFSTKSTTSLAAMPDLQYPTAPINNKYELGVFKSGERIKFHAYTAFATAERSFRGLGPSLAWKASAPVVGDSERGGISLDWGINGAVLFGRQKTRGRHQTTTLGYQLSRWGGLLGNGCRAGDPCEKHGHFYGPHESGQTAVPTTVHRSSAEFDRSRSVIVPNLGGFAGMSFLYSNAKVSLGYRADFFFGAMDGGVDAARKENIGFYGPFASVSVGIGG